MRLDFKIFPKLTTERLILRNIRVTDIDLIYKLHSDPIINSFVGRENTSTLQKTQEYITKIKKLVAQNECLYWVITLKDDDDLIGTICLWNFDIENEIIEIGYEMLSEFQGKGIMGEAIKKITEYAFEDLEAKIIYAFPSSDNVKSVQLLEKMNFKPDNKRYNNKHENIENVITYTLRN